MVAILCVQRSTWQLGLWTASILALGIDALSSAWSGTSHAASHVGWGCGLTGTAVALLHSVTKRESLWAVSVACSFVMLPRAMALRQIRIAPAHACVASLFAAAVAVTTASSQPFATVVVPAYAASHSAAAYYSAAALGLGSSHLALTQLSQSAHGRFAALVLTVTMWAGGAIYHVPQGGVLVLGALAVCTCYFRHSTNVMLQEALRRPHAEWHCLGVSICELLFSSAAYLLHVVAYIANVAANWFMPPNQRSRQAHSMV